MASARRLHAAPRLPPPARPPHRRPLCPPPCPLPAAAAARFADQAAEPFDAEVTLCDQLASYLRKFRVAEAAAAQEEARDLSGALQGFKPIPVSWQGGLAGGAGQAGRDGIAWHGMRPQGPRWLRRAGQASSVQQHPSHRCGPPPALLPLPSFPACLPACLPAEEGD